MSGIRTFPSSQATGNKYIVYEEKAGREHMLAKSLNIDKLMMLHGPKARDYADLNHIAQGMAFSALQDTLSVGRAPFTEMLEGTGSVEVVDKNFAQWKLYGKPETRTMIYGNPNDPANTNLGKNHSTVLVWADFDYYKAGDVVAPIHNKTVELVITSEFPSAFDGGFTYEAVLKNPDPGKTLDPVYFTPGSYWVKLGTVQSHETIGQFGSIQMAESYSYIEYRIPLSTMGWEFEVEAEAHRQWNSILVMRCDDDGRPGMDGVAGITNYIEAKFKAQITSEMELSMVYGRMSDHLIDSVSGKQITTSPGVMEWLEYGQIVNYSPETNSLDFFAEMFKSLWFDRISSPSWNVTLLTGMAGMQLFSNWVRDKFQGQPVTRGYDFVLKDAQPFDKRAGRKGFSYVPPQFTEYVLDGYGSIKVAHWPILDDTRINGVNYPGSMYPVSSYEFIAMDSGFGSSNIKKLVRNDNKYQTYACGYWSPLGGVNSDNPIWKNPNPSIGDAYKLLHRESFGVVVTDPELIVHFRPSVS